MPRGRQIPVGQRVARSFPERWPADLPRDISLPVQGHQLAHRGGAAWSLPLLIGAEMDAKSIQGLGWLAALSLLCAIVAWTVDHAVFASAFFALGGVAILGTASRHQR